MPPTFPKADRIELQHPPLELVVCQLRFPVALGLVNNQPPEVFHRAIRAEYPVTRIRHQTEALVDASGDPQIRASSKTTFWVFEDKDTRWTVSLGADFLSLETRQYRQFDDFVRRFLELTKVAVDTYGIAFRDRLGLRYVDRVSRSRQAALPPDWTGRINPELFPLRRFRGEGEPQMNQVTARFFFAPKRMLTVNAGFIERDFPGIAEDELILDFDCFAEQRSSLDGIREDLFAFKDMTYNAFRWAFGDLIRFFEPAGPATDPNSTEVAR
jgi:uncharacterized protein (TIGR04255 family)